MNSRTTGQFNLWVCGGFLLLNYLVWQWAIGFFEDVLFALVADMMTGGIAAWVLMLLELCRHDDASPVFRRSLRVSVLLLLPLLVLNIAVQGDTPGLIAAIVFSVAHMLISLIVAGCLYVRAK